MAVGDVLRRLTAKCLCHEVRSASKELLQPLQLGCGSPRGCEVAVHTVRQCCRRNASGKDKVTLKIDFSIAFNTVGREAVLRETRVNFPEVVP